MSEIFEISHSPLGIRYLNKNVGSCSLGVLNDNGDRPASLKFLPFHYTVAGMNDAWNKA